MEIFSLAALLALIKKAYDTIGFATNLKWRAFANQIAAYLLGFGAAAIGAHANQFQHIDLGTGVTLGQLDGWSQVLVGMSWAALVGVVGVDFFRSVDNSQSAATPPVVPPTVGSNNPPASEVK